MYTFLGLPVVVIGGWFFPKLGFLLMGCMIGALAIAPWKGRAWCDWMCPRGSFYDLFIEKISLNRKIPIIFKWKVIRVILLTVPFIALGLQFYFVWGDINAMGLAMVKVLTLTTLVGIVLGIIFHHRLWCLVCPMGTLANWLSKDKWSLSISNACTSCKACAKVCPMKLDPFKFKEKGIVDDNDCIKCASCVAKCPKKALSFPEKRN